MALKDKVDDHELLIQALLVEVQALKARVEELENKPAPTPALTPVFTTPGHGSNGPYDPTTDIHE